MNKEQLRQHIIAALHSDLTVLTTAATAAHQAATHEECIPDNKYDTTALEASYIAQGQANRAQEIRVALESYRKLKLQAFDEETSVGLTALITLEDEAKHRRQVFLGPHAGGLKIATDSTEIVVITPRSPLGRNLIGKFSGDEVEAGADASQKTYTITSIC
ncbi:MAG TPA: GreA/GreB family elongation factor [Desulfuromonadaceae bacterium]|jgi:transcription elongation GreA/GreB family factor